MNVGELVVKFAADVQNFTAGAQQVNDSAQKTADAAKTHIEGGFVGSMQKGWSSILEFGAHAYQTFLGVQQAIQMVTGVVGGWVQSAEDAIANQKQLNAVLASTHDAVGMSADQINTMIQRLKSLNGIDDDVILSGENMLLTFTNIGGNVLPQASQAMLDMAVKMNNGSLAGLDLKDTAIQLGKALNDPITGITALSRVGVTFTDQQKEQIKAMVDAGNVAGAQTLIINELEREFGGSAQAAGNVDPFNRFQLAMGDIGKAIGGILLPPLTSLANFITPLANQFLDWLGTLQQSGGVFDTVGSAIHEVLAPLGQIWTAFQSLAEHALQPLVSLVEQHVAPIFASLKKPVDDVASPVLALTNFISDLAVSFRFLVAGIETGNGPFGNLHILALEVGDVLSGLWNTISTNLKPAFDSVWGSIQRVGDVFSKLSTQAGSANSIISRIGTGLGQAFQTAQPILDSLTKTFATLVQDLSTGAISSAQKSFADWAPVIQNVANWFESSLLPAFQQAEPEILNLVNIIVSQGVPAFFSIRDTISHVASVFATTLLPVIERVLPIVVQLGGFIANLLGQAMTFLIPKIVQAAQAIGDFASGIATRLQPFIDKLASGIQIAAGIIQVVWGYLWPWVSSLLKTAIDLIINLVTPLWDTLKFLFNAGADILSGNWKQLWADVKGFFSSITSDLKNIGIGFWNDLKGVFNSLKNDVEDIWNKVWNGLAGVAQSAWNGVKSVVADGINGAIDLINKLIDAADKVPGVNISHIPHVSFAAGGVMGQTGLAMVGERGPEMMLLPGGARIFNNDFVQQLAILASAMGGGSTVAPTSIQAAGLPQVQQGGGIATFPVNLEGSTTSTAGGAQNVTINLVARQGGAPIMSWVGPELVAVLRAAGVRV